MAEGTDADVVIVGSGVGGGAMAHCLAPSGARILILERGERLAREPQNSDAEAVFVDRRYRARQTWLDGEGRPFRPGQYYYVGGHTKFYGTAMFRLRERDFERTPHEDGVSPAWPIRYADLEPFYDEAERLFGVRGLAGIDPTEPPRTRGYAHPPVPHEPLIARMEAKLRAEGLRPFHMPSAIDLREGGACVRCGTCDAFPCRFGAKGDAETRLIDPTLQRHANVTLRTGCRVMRLVTDDPGERIVAAEVEQGGNVQRITARLFVLSAGAIESALLLQRSANARHPHGLANASGSVGRYYMGHNNTALMGLLPMTVNDTRFTKTLAVNDFYFGTADDPWPLGHLQMLGNIQEPVLRSAVPSLPGWTGRWLARHSVDWLAMSEDLPHPQSTVRPLADGSAQLSWHRTNLRAHGRFVARAKRLLRRLGFTAVLSQGFGIENVSHQCGTVRMGSDPAQSALDPWCRAWQHPNLYVVDASFFPSSAAVNPALTVAAQALRVGHALRSQAGLRS